MINKKISPDNLLLPRNTFLLSVYISSNFIVFFILIFKFYINNFCSVAKKIPLQLTQYLILIISVGWSLVLLNDTLSTSLCRKKVGLSISSFLYLPSPAKIYATTSPPRGLKIKDVPSFFFLTGFSSLGG